MSDAPQEKTPEEFASSPARAAFVAAGGYEALLTLKRILRDQRLSYAILLDFEDDGVSAGHVGDDASLQVQCAVLAAQDRLEDLATALMLLLSEKVEDAPVAPEAGEPG